MKWCAVILGGGTGSRMGAGRNKVLLPLRGEAVLCRSVRAFTPVAEAIVLVLRPEDRAEAEALLEAAGLRGAVSAIAPAGETRQASVWNGLQALPPDCSHVLIHDGARCLVDAGTIRRVMACAEAHGGAIPVIPVQDTIVAETEDGRTAETYRRDSLRAVQTPQGFRLDWILEAHRRARAEGFTGTDDASLLRFVGQPVYHAQGDPGNLKLTTQGDLRMAEQRLDQEKLPPWRVGYGYDVHALTEGRKLILCGVEIPHSLGLLGHSDADVALHALMDAMLGAMGLGDIGQLFSDQDPQYEGISSLLLLERVTQLLAAHGARTANADITIVAQRPKLLPYREAMRAKVAEALSLPPERVSVKATTTERLGFEGRMEGISATAVVLMQTGL